MHYFTIKYFFRSVSNFIPNSVVFFFSNWSYLIKSDMYLSTHSWKFDTQWINFFIFSVTDEILKTIFFHLYFFHFLLKQAYQILMFYQYLHHLKSDWTCGRMKLLFFNLDVTGFQIFFTPLITIFRKKSFF